MVGYTSTKISNHVLNRGSAGAILQSIPAQPRRRDRPRRVENMEPHEDMAGREGIGIGRAASQPLTGYADQRIPGPDSSSAPSRIQMDRLLRFILRPRSPGRQIWGVVLWAVAAVLGIFMIRRGAWALLQAWGDVRAAWRRLAYFVDRIIKGAKPADLPIDLPTIIEMVVNRRIAMNLVLPPALLLRADRVIDEPETMVVKALGPAQKNSFEPPSRPPKKTPRAPRRVRRSQCASRRAGGS